MKGMLFAAPLIGVLCCAPAAPGAVISYTNQTLNDPTVPRALLLRLHNDGSEWGYAQRDPVSHEDFFGGHAEVQSRTLTVQNLLNRGITADNFAVLLTIKEPLARPRIEVTNFTLVFYDANDHVLSTANFTQDSPLILTPVTPVPGKSGHVFTIGLTEDQRSTFFANPANRIGIIVPEDSPITRSQGGPEKFVIVAAANIPSPGSLALLGVALFMTLRDRSRPRRLSLAAATT
jgi:hypothetical protein